MKKVVDEREELELLKIEHKAFYTLYYGLVIIAILMPIFPEYRGIAFYGVYILIIISCGIVRYECVKKGLWSCKIKPTKLNNALCSLVDSILISTVFFISLSKYYDGKKDKVIMICAVISVVIFSLEFVVLTLIKKIVLNRQEKLAESLDDDFNDK